jgi:hypothetical protein
MIQFLEGAMAGLAATRRQAIAQAVEWPDSSMAKVASALGISKSAVAKLAPGAMRLTASRRLAEDLTNKRAAKRAAEWANALRSWAPDNTTGLGNGRVRYLIASVAPTDGKWSWVIHDHKRGPQELARGLGTSERDVRIEAVNELRRYDEFGSTNGRVECRHYAHMGENACGAPVEEPIGERFDTTTCGDCLAAMGLLV